MEGCSPTWTGIGPENGSCSGSCRRRGRSVPTGATMRTTSSRAIPTPARYRWTEISSSRGVTKSRTKKIGFARSSGCSGRRDLARCTNFRCFVPRTEYPTARGSATATYSSYSSCPTTSRSDERTGACRALRTAPTRRSRRRTLPSWCSSNSPMTASWNSRSDRYPSTGRRARVSAGRVRLPGRESTEWTRTSEEKRRKTSGTEVPTSRRRNSGCRRETSSCG